MTYQILKHFSFTHLPPDLQYVSEQFHRLAFHLATTMPEGQELETCLRKLLDAKDCAVRAKLADERTAITLEDINRNDALADKAVDTSGSGRSG